MRFWTPTNIASILGDASAASSCSSGSRRISDSATDSASDTRPRAYRQNARYWSACRAMPGTLARASVSRDSVDSASSYAADAYRSFAMFSGS